MFLDEKSVDYKLGCKYNLQLESEENFESALGCKLATRSSFAKTLKEQS
jgi:hypothetical protein